MQGRSAFETFVYGTIILVCVLIWSFVELRGAWGRWKKGQPIRRSANDARILAEKRDLEERQKCERKSELYTEYERNPIRLVNDQDFYTEFRKHWDWQSIRAEVVRDWNKKSDSCPACGREIKKLHVDHIQPRSKYPHLRFLKSNLQVLCSRCNQRKHAYDGDDWEEAILARDKEKRRRARKAYSKKRKAKLFQ